MDRSICICNNRQNVGWRDGWIYLYIIRDRTFDGSICLSFKLLLCGWSNSRCELLVAWYVLHPSASPVKAWISSSEHLHFTLLIPYNERPCCELAFPLIFSLQLVIPWNLLFLIKHEAVWVDKHRAGWETFCCVMRASSNSGQRAALF